MSTKRWSRAELRGIPPIVTWPTVATNLLSSSEKERFAEKCEAIKLYLSGVSTEDIKKTTGVSRWDLPRMVKRCLEFAPDGQIFGFRAIISHVHIDPYIRKKEPTKKLKEQHGGLSGVLNATLTRFPGIEKELVTLIKKSSKAQRIHEHKIHATTLHHIFIDCLKSHGVRETEWPFNTKYQGARSIQRFMKTVLDANFGQSVNAREERAAKAHLAVGNGVEPLLCFEEPFDAVEIDAYYINALLSVAFSTPEGTKTYVLLDRLWLLAALDRASSAILANSVVYSSQVGSDDVIRVIRDAVSNKWQPMELTIKGLSYPKSGGYPSGVIPVCYGANWGCLLLDGALAHLSKQIRESARRTLGFSLNWGPVGHFERRPNVERFFKSISDNIFRRLPSTTGSSPRTGRSDNAEANAIRYKIDAHEVEELIDVYIAQYNATPTSGLSFLSPLEFIQHFTEDPDHHFLIRHLPQNVMKASTPIPCVMKCTVRGGRSNGRRPYIQIDNVRYTSYLLGHTSALIGQQIVVEIDEEDMRQVKAFTTNGAELGFLKASGRWSQTKHSRKTRKAINALLYRRILVLSEFDDPVQVYLSYLSKPSDKVTQKSQVVPSSNAVEATRISQESKLPLKISSPSPNIDNTTSTHLKDQKTGLIMDSPSIDLNQLVNRKF